MNILAGERWDECKFEEKCHTPRTAALIKLLQHKQKMPADVGDDISRRWRGHSGSPFGHWGLSAQILDCRIGEIWCSRPNRQAVLHVVFAHHLTFRQQPVLGSQPVSIGAKVARRPAQSKETCNNRGRGRRATEPAEI